jgi:hypothetical protein
MPRRKDDSDKYTEELQFKHNLKFKAKIWGLRLLWLFGLYLGVALGAYALGHPEQTQTQVFLNLFDALLWQW